MEILDRLASGVLVVAKPVGIHSCAAATQNGQPTGTVKPGHQKVFSGLTFCVSVNPTNRNDVDPNMVVALIVDNGGCVEQKCNSGVNFLVASDLGSKKARTAMSERMRIVTVQWINKCVKSQMIQTEQGPEDLYHPAASKQKPKSKRNTALPKSMANLEAGDRQLCNAGTHADTAAVTSADCTSSKQTQVVPLTRDMVCHAVNEYGIAWTTQDPDRIAALFTASAVYVERPFDSKGKLHTYINHTCTHLNTRPIA